MKSKFSKLAVLALCTSLISSCAETNSDEVSTPTQKKLNCYGAFDNSFK